MANQWDRINKRNAERLRLVLQESHTEIASRTIERSPVDSGLFRNNWFSGLNNPNLKVTANVAKKAFGTGGGARFNEALQLTTEFTMGDVLFLTNSLPYARRIEFGWSQMAPNGIVRLTAAQWQSIVTKVARKIR